MRTRLIVSGHSRALTLKYTSKTAVGQKLDSQLVHLPPGARKVHLTKLRETTPLNALEITQIHLGSLGYLPKLHAQASLFLFDTLGCPKVRIRPQSMGAFAPWGSGYSVSSEIGIP
jgi:hypothetical protein